MIEKCFEGNKEFLAVLKLHGEIKVPPRPGRRDGKRPDKRIF
jgi:hypothetical protein